MSADKSQTPEQGLLALRAEWRKGMVDGVQMVGGKWAAVRCADALTPHIAAQKRLLDACRALCNELDYLEATNAPCIPSLGVMAQIKAAIRGAGDAT